MPDVTHVGRWVKYKRVGVIRGRLRKFHARIFGFEVTDFHPYFSASFVDITALRRNDSVFGGYKVKGIGISDITTSAETVEKASVVGRVEVFGIDIYAAVATDLQSAVFVKPVGTIVSVTVQREVVFHSYKPAGMDKI